LLDDDLFFDAMHPTLRGQVALAQVVLSALSARGAFGWPEDRAAPVLDPAEVVSHFRLDNYAWYILAKWGAMVYDLTAGAHYDPGGRRARVAAYDGAVAKLQAGVAPEEVGLPGIGRPEAVTAYEVDRYGRKSARQGHPPKMATSL